MNKRLKWAFIESGRKQIEIAADIGMAESKLSKIVHGHLEATEDEQKAIAKALGKRPEVLFSDVA